MIELPKIKIEPKSVAILLTDKCTAECKMCCFGCSPQNSTVMEPKMIQQIMLYGKRD